MKTIKAAQFIFTLMLLSVATDATAQFSQVVSIGDSLSDTGNTQDASFGVEPPDAYFFGRFSNGQVWNELLAIELGLTAPTSSRDGGNNYAYGGALTSQDVQIVVIPIILVITLPSATNQIFEYLNDVSNAPDENALYTLSIGGNDILEAGDLLNTGASQAEIDMAKQEMRNIAGSLEVAVQQLLDNLPAEGEARLVMLNVPNVGITPRAIDANKQNVFEQLSLAYNEGLNAVVAALDDPRILLVDFFALTNDAAANPVNYGLINVTDACYDDISETVCANPDEYLFWDDIHPTSIGHTALMLAVLDQLFPVESANVPIAHGYSWLLLLVLAGGVLCFGHRYRST